MEKILIIYDDPGSQWTALRTLEAAGFDVSSAACGPMAMEVFCATKPGLVVFDVSLRGTLTQDLCSQIRHKSNKVLILVLSSNSDAAEVALLLKLGADSYITKPVSSAELLARVRALLRHLEPLDLRRFGKEHHGSSRSTRGI